MSGCIIWFFVICLLLYIIVFSWYLVLFFRENRYFLNFKTYINVIVFFFCNSPSYTQNYLKNKEEEKKNPRVTASLKNEISWVHLDKTCFFLGGGCKIAEQAELFKKQKLLLLDKMSFKLLRIELHWFRAPKSF